MRISFRLAIVSLFSCTIVMADQSDLPRSQDRSVKIALFAEAPDIVTPIGATIDAKGRLLVIESHSHLRTKDYKGPPTDRIRIFEDTTGSNRADKISTLYEGQNFLMNLAAEKDGSVVVSSRNEIFRLSPTGQKTTLAHLETKADYPHNGLHGLALDPAGNIYVGIGENFGGPWTLTGTDDHKISDDTGSGAVFRMDSKGGGLVRISHGFWNPFGVGVDPSGNVWALDNDPDGRPPCRLVQIVPGADYGFELRYGRTGLHPLQCWDGELPGTLPMVAGVGEAPCAVRWHRGKLLVTSWRDHVIQRITLTPRGASYAADVQSLITGGENFRPVGLAEAADGSIFVTDWVSSSYPVHGKGRIWKLTFTDRSPVAPPAGPTEGAQRAAQLRQSHDTTELLAALDDTDPFIAQAAQYGLAQLPDLQKIEWSSLKSAPQRIGVLASMLIANSDVKANAERALDDSDDRVRQMGIRVIAETNLKDLRPQVAKLMDSKTLSPRLLGMIAATLGQLDGDRAAKVDPKKINDVLLGRLKDAQANDEAKASAVHMLLANHPKVPMAQFAPLLHSPSAALQREVVRYLSDDPDLGRFALLDATARDEKADPGVRAEAIDGLADDAANHVDLLMQFARGSDTTLRQEALRSLRPIGPQLTKEQQDGLTESAKSEADTALVNRLLNHALGQRPEATDTTGWQRLLDEAPGDPEAGRRVFFNSAGAGCARCHILEGRGRAIGPDLTMIGHSQTTEHVLESILQPSKDIAPLFMLWTIKTKQGLTVDGMLLRRDGQANEVYVDSAGLEIRVKEPDVIDRKMRKESLMPAGLVDGMTTQELRDVIALLMQKR